MKKLRIGIAIATIPVVVWLFNLFLSAVSEPSDVAVLLGWVGLIGLVFTLPPMYKKLLFVAAIAALSFSEAACTSRIAPGHVGIVVNQWGSEKGVQDYTARTGMIVYNPFTTSVYTYPTYMQNYVWTANPNEGKAVDESITFTIKGNMAISVDVSIAYALDPAKVPFFYTTFRSDDLENFTHGYLHNVTRDCFNEVGGRYELDQVMGDNAEFIAAVKSELVKRTTSYGVKVDQFGIIGAPRPPQEVKDAISAKIKATQTALQKQNELAQAQADAAKAVAQAEGEAKSTLARAEAQAKANRLLSDSLTDKLVQYEAIQKWDGTLPAATSGNTLPLLKLN